MPGHFATVEINNTSTACRRGELARWAEEVRRIRLHSQAPRRIHHERVERVRDPRRRVPQTRASAGGQARALAVPAAAYLKEDLSRLRDSSRCCRGPACRFEFRNESWQDGEVYERCARRARCSAIPTPRKATRPYRRDRRQRLPAPAAPHYADPDLGDWVERSRAALRARLRHFMTGRRAGHGVRAS